MDKTDQDSLIDETSASKVIQAIKPYLTQKRQARIESLHQKVMGILVRRSLKGHITGLRSSFIQKSNHFLKECSLKIGRSLVAL